MVLKKGEYAGKFMRMPYIINHVGIKLNISKCFFKNLYNSIL